jgi:lactoylglutathione lyase
MMKFGYTIFYVKSIVETVEFYEKAFGLQRKFIHESEQYAELDTGSTTLSFASLEMGDFNKVPILSELPSNKSPAMEIAFVTDDVPAAFMKALGAGAEPIAEPTQKPWGQTVCYVRDINRFLVEICSPMG